MISTTSKFVAEMIGTMVLVLMGCGSAVIAGADGTTGVGLLGIAFAFGLSVVAMAYAIGHISGCHINPAISIAMVVAGRMKMKEAGVYIVAQIIGGIIGSGILYIIFMNHPGAEMKPWALGANGWGPGYLGEYTIYAALIAEFIFTFIFLLVILGSTSTKNIHGGYSYKLSKTFTLYASLGYSERIPTASERYGFYLFNRMDNHDYIGNPLLKNESAINSELNFVYSQNGFLWKIAGFHNYLNNYIQGGIRNDLSVMTIGAAGVRSYINLPHAKMTGLENHFNYKFYDSRFTVNQTLKLIRGTTLNNIPLPLMSPVKAITSLRYNHKHWFVQAENELSGKQNRIDPSFGEQQTAGYSLFNLRTNYHFKMQQKNDVNFSVGVENIFNKAYLEHLDWGNYLRPGRNMYASISFAL